MTAGDDSPFEDDWSRSFYETLPDLKARLPGVLLQAPGEDAKEDDQDAKEDDQDDQQDGQKDGQKDGQQADQQADQETPATQTQPNAPLEPLAGAPAELQAVLTSLPTCAPGCVHGAMTRCRLLRMVDCSQVHHAAAV